MDSSMLKHVAAGATTYYLTKSVWLSAAVFGAWHYYDSMLDKASDLQEANDKNTASLSELNNYINRVPPNESTNIDTKFSTMPVSHAYWTI